jgi:hypothetical protein
VGLLLDSSCPQLGCSADNLVIIKNTGEVGVMEIKCFPTLENCHPKDFKSHLSKKRLKTFCLQKTKSEITIKKNSYIYYQIQMQLGITKLKWCFLVFWSPHGILTLKVDFDESFWMSFKCKLLDFHSEYLVPELFLMRAPRSLPPLKITHFD